MTEGFKGLKIKGFSGYIIGFEKMKPKKTIGEGIIMKKYIVDEERLKDLL